MRRVRDAGRCIDQEMAVCCVANHNAPLHLAQIVQPMLAEQHIQQVRQPQNSPHTAPCQFLLFPALSTLWEVKRLNMRNDQKYRHTTTYTDAPSGLLEVLLAKEEPLE